MAAPTHRGRSWYTLALLALTALTLFTLDFRGFGPLESVQSGLRSAFSPVRSAGESITKPISNGAEGLFNYGDLEEENARLEARIAELEGRIFQIDAEEAELKRLKAELGLDYVGDLPTVIAEVITGPVGNFASQSVDINRGTADGITEGMPVVTGAGLVGRVTRADRSRAVVQLIIDAEFTVGVRIASETNPDEIGLGHGDGPGSPRQITVDQGIDLGIAVGDLVVTSGGRTSLFPPGLPIGVVSDVIEKDRGLELKVELNAAPDQIGFVNVVLFEAEE